MAGSTLGSIFKVSTFGESHGDALGVIVDGCPSGLSLNENDIQIELDKRKPGKNPYGTKRAEDDKVSILSGVFDGITTGTPIAMIVYNKDQKSSDYNNIKDILRPGHADFTFYEKYGIRDYRGGGRSSGRETLSRVAAGAVAKKILNELNVTILGYTESINRFKINKFSESDILNNPLYMPDMDTYKECSAFLDELIKNHDSAGGVIAVKVNGLMAGIGEPVYDKLDASLAKSMFSIGGVKGFEIGSGFQAPKMLGSEHNDTFIAKNYKIVKLTNNAGGILGGISDGDELFFKVHFKPTPSIYKTQKTVDINKNNIEINISGRHDPLIVPRAVVVVEAMTAITLVDLIFCNMTANISKIKKFYK